jgi:hypothetical protein
MATFVTNAVTTSNPTDKTIVHVSRSLEEPSLATTFLRCLFIFYISPLHVSVLAGHLQAEYTIIFRKLPTHDVGQRGLKHVAAKI